MTLQEQAILLETKVLSDTEDQKIQAQNIIDANGSLIIHAIHKENYYTTSVFFISVILFVVSFIFMHTFAAIFLFFAITCNLIQSRISYFGIAKEMEINVKTILYPQVPKEKNVYDQLINVLHWCNLGFICLGSLFLLFLK